MPTEKGSSIPKFDHSFADGTNDDLDKYEETKRNLQKTGVLFTPTKRVKFDKKRNGKDF